MTLQLPWEAHVETHCGQHTCDSTQFCGRYTDRAAALKRSMRQQHRAGETRFADFAGQIVPILGHAEGVALKAHVFVVVPGTSNDTCVWATRAETMPNRIGSLIAAMESFAADCRWAAVASITGARWDFLMALSFRAMLAYRQTRLSR